MAVQSWCCVKYSSMMALTLLVGTSIFRQETPKPQGYKLAQPPLRTHSAAADRVRTADRAAAEALERAREKEAEAAAKAAAEAVLMGLPPPKGYAGMMAAATVGGGGCAGKKGTARRSSRGNKSAGPARGSGGSGGGRGVTTGGALPGAPIEFHSTGAASWGWASSSSANGKGGDGGGVDELLSPLQLRSGTCRQGQGSRATRRRRREQRGGGSRQEMRSASYAATAAATSASARPATAAAGLYSLGRDALANEVTVTGNKHKHKQGHGGRRAAAVFSGVSLLTSPRREDRHYGQQR
eukprot:COSAG05_NODE_3792_length_1834_cov_4.086912_1_plen_296_part_10